LYLPSFPLSNHLYCIIMNSRKRINQPHKEIEDNVKRAKCDDNTLFQSKDTACLRRPSQLDSGSSTNEQQVELNDTPNGSLPAQASSIRAAPGSSATKWKGLKGFASSAVIKPVTGLFGPIKDVAEVFVECVDNCKMAGAANAEYDVLRARLEVLFEDLRGYFGEGCSPKMNSSMENLCNSIQEELDFIRKKREKSKGARYLAAKGEADEILACLRRVEGYLQRLLLNANLTMWKIAQEQANDSRSNHIFTLVDRLPSSLPAWYNSAEGVELKRRGCTLGTRVDILAKVHGWVCNRGEGAVYWLNGMAGTGKTTIAYSTCAALDDAHKLAASFFCSRLREECRNVNTIIPSIAYQLARFSRPFHSALSAVIEKDPDIHGRLLRLQFDSLIIQPMLQVQHTLPEVLVVVIDALDECENKESTRLMLDLLLKNVENLPIRFIVSSRPEPEIRDQMTDEIVKSRLVLHELDKGEVQLDIEKYLRESLAQMSPTDAQISELAKRAGILFIYAATAVRYIGYDNFQSDPEDRMRTLLGGSQSEDDGENEDIDQLYMTVLEVALGNRWLRKVERDNMRQVLYTVICAHEPLTVAGLSELLQIDGANRVRAALRPLWSVIHVVGSNELVTTLHASFPDFMLDTSRSNKYHCDPIIHHRILAEKCFGRIKRVQPQFNICGLESSYLPDEMVPDIEERVVKAIPSELLYACRYWAAHFKEGKREEMQIEQLQEFLSKQLLLWMEVLNLSKQMRSGMECMKLICQWCEQLEGNAELIELAHDADRFVGTFLSNAISKSTPHIYLSMLSLWPRSSPVSMHYAEYIHGPVEAEGEALEQREQALLATWPFEGSIEAIAMSPGGQYIGLGIEDLDKVVIVDTTSGEVILELSQVLTGTIKSLAFSPDGSRIMAGLIWFSDATILGWDTCNGDMVFDPIQLKVDGRMGEVRCLKLSPDCTRIATGCRDNSLRLWDIETGEMLLRLTTERPINNLAFSPDGAQFAVTSIRTITVYNSHWRIENSNLGPVACLIHAGWSDLISFSPDGARIISANGSISIWDAKTGVRILGRLTEHRCDISSIEYSPDGRYFSSGHVDGTISVWDAQTGKIVLDPLELHTGNVVSLAFSADSTRMFSIGQDRLLCIWDFRRRVLASGNADRYSHRITSVKVSSDGSSFASGSEDGTICIWSTYTGEIILGPVAMNIGQICAIDFLDNRVVSGSSYGEICAYDALNERLVLGPLNVYPADNIRTVEYSSDGKWILTTTRSGRVGILDARTGLLILALVCDADGGRIARFSPDCSRIACTTSDEWGFQILDSQDGSVVLNMLEASKYSYISSVSYSPNSTLIALGSRDRVIKIINAWTGAVVLTESYGNDRIQCIDFSPDSTHIVSTSDNRTIQIRDVQTGEIEFEFPHGHVSNVTSVAYSPCGTHILSFSECDMSVRVHDARGVGQTALPPFLAEYGEWEIDVDGWISDNMARLLAWPPREMQKSEVETDILDVSEYLSLKLLGRDAKVKLSDVFDATKWAGNSSLLAVSNKLGWFVAGTPTSLVASPLTHLRETQANSTGDGPTPIEPKHRISLSGAPYFVHFATSHTKVVVVVRAEDIWNLEIFNAEDICRESAGDVKPTHTLSLGTEDVVDMQPNPSEGSDVVAILRGRSSSSSCLDMINIATASRITSWGAANSADESTALTSSEYFFASARATAHFGVVSWSVRGKQIVVGTRGGELVQFTPEGERKQTIPPPPSLSSPQSVVSVLWLENTVFHVVYGNPTSDPSDPTHEYEVYNILFDSKMNSANYVKFIDPAPPYGVTSRLSCRHYARLVGWEPAKHLIFVSDGPSTDVGAIACLNPSETESKPSPWVTLEVDETSRIALPMDDEMNETSIMGFDLDLTATEPISNSQEAGDDAVPSPPSPILHLYTSAGLVISYHVLNSRGDKYPGMGTAEVPSAVSATPAKTLASTTPSATPVFGASMTPAGMPGFGVTGFGMSATPVKPSPFGQASTTPAFGQPSTTPAATPAFGQTSAPAFGQGSAFGTTSAFGSKPAFGSASFGAAGGGGFGKFSSSTPAGTPASGGFAGFGSKPATFGSTLAPTTNVFGSGSGTTTPKTESPLSAFGSSTFGGGTSATTPKSAFGGFGSSIPSVSSPVKPRDGSTEPESPPPVDKPPIEMSPPGSPAAQSDSEIEVGDLSIGGLGKKPPAGLDVSDDESEHDPTETPSKPPASTSGFTGFGKSSAFGTAATAGAFAIKPATGGAFGSSTGTTFGAAKPAGGFGAFGSKSTSASTGFSFGAGAKNAEKPAFSFSGGPAFGSSAFGSSADGGSTPAFGSSTFGSSTSGISTPTFGSTAFGPNASGSSAPVDSAPKTPTGDEQRNEQNDALFKSAMSFLDGVFGSASKPGSGFGAAPTFGTTSAPAFGTTSAFGAAAKPADSSAPKTGGGFSALAAPKPGESKITGGFAGFGDAAKNKGGFLGFGDGPKKDIFAEPAKSEEKKEDEEKKEELTPNKDPEEPGPDTKPEAPKTTVGSPLVSPPSPKPKSPSPEATKSPKEAPSRIPVPKPSLLDRLSPRPEPQEQAEPEPPKSESSTPPGSPSPSASPPPAPPKSAPPPTPSPFGLGKPPLKPFGSAPLRSSPLASPPVTRENEAKPFSETPSKPPALTSKTSSENVAKPASTGFVGFGKPAATEEKRESKPATAAAPSAKPPSLFSGPSALPSPFSAPKLPVSTSPAPTTAAPSAAKPSFFGAPAASSTTAPPTSSPFSGFGTKLGSSPFSAPSSSPPSLFAQPPAAKTPPAGSTPAAPPPSFGFANFKPQSSSSPATPPPSAEPSSSNTSALSNVEVEFNKLLEHMSAELGKLRQDTAMLQQRHAQISRANIPTPVAIQKTEEPSKWGLGDLAALKQVTGLVAKEIDGLKGLNKDFIAQMTALQPGAEKVQAKRNEIARYIKAKKDPKYTRLLKSRTSSPEHIESQTKLRKSLQIVRERTRQLEDFMAAQRSRIQKQKEGRREFKVPSIDTINRTMRNIDSALAQKSEEIVTLTARVDRMKLKGPRRKASTAVAPLALPPAENEKIKLASASALNMERSSLRLKNALLQARTETPLNTTAVGAPVEEKPNTLAKVMPSKPPVPATPATSMVLPTMPPATSTPASTFPLFSQPPATPNPFAPKAPVMPAKTSSGGFSFAPVAPATLPAFTPLGKDEFHVTAGYEHSARRSEKSRMHGSSAKFKTPSPNISRTLSDAETASPLPAPTLAPTITPAKSFFGSGPTSTPSTGGKAASAPDGFFSFSTPSAGPVASTPPPPKGFSFFQTPAQKAATTSTTPAIPPIPSWATPNSSISSTNSSGSVKSRVKDDQEDDEGSEGSEEHSGEEGEDEEDDEDWIPDDEDEEDEDVSDGVPEGEEDDEDQTARI
ncbi:unnamed protein product, partial [Rhizoctonia solani]